MKKYIFLIIVLLIIPIVTALYTLKDSYTTGDTGDSSFSNAVYKSQTFTTSSSYIPVYIGIKEYEISGSGSTITYQIRTTSSSKPTATVLCSVSISADTEVSHDANGEWDYIVIHDCPSLSTTTMYALVGIETIGTSTIGWRVDDTGSYTGGDLVYSTNSGGSWTILSGYDYMFEVYANQSSPSYSHKVNSIVLTKINTKVPTKVSNI